MIHAPMSRELYVGFSVTRSLAAEKDQSTGVCVCLCVSVSGLKETERGMEGCRKGRDGEWSQAQAQAQATSHKSQQKIFYGDCYHDHWMSLIYKKL